MSLSELADDITESWSGLFSIPRRTISSSWNGIENNIEKSDTKMMNQTIVTCFLVEINDKINQNAVSNEELKVTQCLEKQKYLRRYKGFVLLFWS